ncbi:EAL domain-containing protein [Jeotgalibacillus sp. R-1-5s-1]|uniref:EAL domain-containing protein n=1 Tax=Jeotgalibacillus sp. R-1-5s-1 TaxID=2555897 RepID=UPI00106B0B87|nr:EAL domain-containing protein [Jeotgalibacillus sp. R-1-5s-1]TFE03696.1 EAL domain-containing protein [Jeotgalibacillus sp. R-1-5s-1]
MKSQCVHCGVSVSFDDKGTFYVKANESEISRLSFNFDHDKGVFYRDYTSLKEIEIILAEMEEMLDAEIQCGVSSNGHLTRYMPMHLFSVRLRHRNTVHFIQHGKMISHLQPIMDIKNGELYGYESLLRADKDENPISPYELFQVANAAEMHSLLDQRAREEAIKARKEKIDPGVKSFINFLPSTIYNPEYCLRHTFQIVNKYNVDPRDLVFEVVETEKINDVDHLKKVFKTYKREGMKVALDDVGAGFSTIDMLKMLEPDYVKIDRSYISFCDQDHQKQDFLHRVYQTSEQLGIKVLAEGMERNEELEICKKIGFDLGQGYLIGKPSEKAIVPELKKPFAS